MAVDRPTFSDVWHRVRDLTPRLRPVVQCYRQHYRGQRWHVLRDPSSDKFFRVDEVGYHFLMLLHGQRTVDEAWQIAADRFGDEAPTQGEAVQLLGQLYTNNLLEAQLPPDSQGMFDRYRKRRQREVGSYMMNLLFARIPLFDPDRILEKWEPVFGFLFGPVGWFLWLGIMAFGVISVIGQTDKLADQAGSILAADNLPLLYVAMVITKLLHEFGHGFACKRFGRLTHSGGEVHVLGVMLIALMPLPYVDASSSWAFGNKWQRAFVGAAGMYVELAVAAIAAIIWSRTGDGTVVHSLCHNIIFIAGVSTLLFNANPLIKFDGYYILSDLIEMPNLAQRSRDYVYYLVKRYAYGVRRPNNPSHSLGELPLLVGYYIASGIYRIFISITILLFVANQLFFIGMLLAISGLVAWLLIPMVQLTKYLAANDQLLRTRGRAVVVTATAIGAIVASVGLIPVTEHGRAQGVVEPRTRSIVHASTDGRVHAALQSGRQIKQGEVLVSMQNIELRLERDRLAAQLELHKLEMDKALADDQVHWRVGQKRWQTVVGQLQDLDRRIAELDVIAPHHGTWTPTAILGRRGLYALPGEELGMLATLDDLRLRVAADQFLGPRLLDRHADELAHAGAWSATVRVKGRPDLEFQAQVQRVLPAGRTQLPSPALGLLAGGTIRQDMQSQQPDMAAEPYFQVDLVEPGEAGKAWPTLLAGQRVVVRFALGKSPLGVQWYRTIRQVVQDRLEL